MKLYLYQVLFYSQSWFEISGFVIYLQKQMKRWDEINEIKDLIIKTYFLKVK